MKTPTIQLQCKSLHRTLDQSAYNLYRAALEWDLADPILIRDREDLKSESTWRERVEPYLHQVKNLISFCRRLPVTLLADDVGLGKTISAGLVVSELMSRGRISKVLVVCPKLLMPQWKEELETKFNIPAVIATGKDLATTNPPEEGGVVITTYHSARAYLEEIRQIGFEMLILDEAHKLRNLYGVNQPPLVAKAFRQVLEDHVFKYVLMLTATPIQNRLWDIYSLIDLLTIARGHENPFGTPRKFESRFIEDNATEARRLKPEKREEFRSIVYSYMSRVRRDDANLHFPDRVVQLHKVEPSDGERALIETIAAPIQKLNRLSQISILQALISSPQALAVQLRGMAERRTVPASLAREVEEVAKGVGLTAKMRGLGALADKLRAEDEEHWRMVVFTTRRETQASIESFLEERNIACGLINGESGKRNQETIANFKTDPPEIHVIVSTEAGSEGVNLQVANVIVNYDLPWNPMVVEQRIGRIQRLASAHASVCVFNIILKGTFEEYIVGRLMEKLQLASHVVGDIEALLEASGLGEKDEDGADGFEEMIRRLVVASLAGKDIEAATSKAEKSINDAKKELDQEEKNIDDMLGGKDANEAEIPLPRFPEVVHSIDSKSFAIAALTKLGVRLTPTSSGLYVAEENGKRELIYFEDNLAEIDGRARCYKPGSTLFGRVVSKITNTPFHMLTDGDIDTEARAERMGEEWVNSFGGGAHESKVEEVQRSFTGTVMVRVRATVAHDSYERLVDIDCQSGENWSTAGPNGIDVVGETVDNAELIGLDTERILENVRADEGISEFCRYYRARCKLELAEGGEDERRQKKITDDFTPRLEVFLVGVNGSVIRKLRLRISYDLRSSDEYISRIAVIPSTNTVAWAPEMGGCSISGRQVPHDCLDKCEISGKDAMKHFLVRSELSGRVALPTYAVKCAESGKLVLTDEAESSAITNQMVSKSLMRESAVSGKRAESRYFARCEFTGSELLQDELSVSQISGKKYRSDQQMASGVSGRTGHQTEFIVCTETSRVVAQDEAERCENTGKLVAPGVLEPCEVSAKKVLPSELERCAATGKRALKKFFVSSSISGARVLENEAIRSIMGMYCLPQEAGVCTWSNTPYHPDDLRTCALTRIPIHFKYTNKTENGRTYFEPLFKLLDGVTRKWDKIQAWPLIVSSVSNHVGGRIKIETAEGSSDGSHLAVCLEVKDRLGLRTRHVGLIYLVKENSVVGRIVKGRREKGEWIFEQTL